MWNLCIGNNTVYAAEVVFTPNCERFTKIMWETLDTSNTK